MHDFLKKTKRRHVKEIPLAPILDLLTVVIFFLILSASFIEIRQDTLPPSSTVVTKSDPLVPIVIPLNPKLILGKNNGEMVLLLKWFGQTPGQIIKKLKLSKSNYDANLKQNTNDIVKDFMKKFPKESQIQLGWQGNIKYQTVLTVVDGVLTEMKDLVFISPEEAETLFQKSF
jgi:biopolymer transport protein ExbD